MKHLLAYLADLLWPRPAAPAPDGRLPPGCVIARLGGGWTLEVAQAVIDGRHWLLPALVCPSRRHMWANAPLTTAAGEPGFRPQEVAVYQYLQPN